MSAFVNLSATFHVGQDSENLYCKFQVKVHFSGGPADLKAVLYVGVDAFEELFAKFETQNTEDLFAKFIVRHSAFRNLFAEFRPAVLFSEGWEDVYGKFVVSHSDSEDLKAILTVRNAGFAQLYAKLEVTARLDFFAKFTVRHSDYQELFNKLIVRNADAAELKGIIVIRHTGVPLNLFATFEPIPNESLKAIFVVRHSTFVDLRAEFYTRFPTRLWTNRRYINGVVDAAENLLGDAILEYVIEGVMEDIQTWMLANALSYDSFTDITITPVALRRATTYGVVASLFARKTKTFTSRVIPTVQPVTVTVRGDDREAMAYWERRYEQMLELYLTTSGSSRMWVSTEDEEPIFTMAGIPADSSPAGVPTTTEDSWHEWLRQRGR